MDIEERWGKRGYLGGTDETRGEGGQQDGEGMMEEEGRSSSRRLGRQVYERVNGMICCGRGTERERGRQRSDQLDVILGNETGLERPGLT